MIGIEETGTDNALDRFDCDAPAASVLISLLLQLFDASGNQI